MAYGILLLKEDRGEWVESIYMMGKKDETGEMSQ